MRSRLLGILFLLVLALAGVAAWLVLPHKVGPVEFLRLSRATSRNIQANIAFSIVLKAAFLVMAITGTATLWMAVGADMGASLLVIANALRLLRE